VQFGVAPDYRTPLLSNIALPQKIPDTTRPQADYSSPQILFSYQATLDYLNGDVEFFQRGFFHDCGKCADTSGESERS
jgi:hypothetical protein